MRSFIISLSFSGSAESKSKKSFGWIRNNAKGSYPVGDYSVFVSTYGNDKIDQCYVQEVALNLNTMDLTMPFLEEFNVIDEDGNPVLIELSFEPASLSRGQGSTTGSASVGRYWTRATSGVVTLDYSFDVYLHGTSQWEISRKSDLFYSGYFVTFSNPRTTIIRSVCTGTYPAEIHGLVNAAFFTNSWTGPIASKSIYANTTIAYTGKLTIMYGL
ncbi:MAG: hypothetical protein FWG40_08145 [Peptococcaceae bacterium]|nr:hypothetical protein [Peptococcaceae bacterium]